MTEHVLRERLPLYRSFVSEAEVRQAVERHGDFQVHCQTTVVVKNLGRTYRVWDRNGEEHHGDLVIAVVDRDGMGDTGRIVTIMLRGHWQPARTVRLKKDIPQHARGRLWRNGK
jgi:hypothetical protein